MVRLFLIINAKKAQPQLFQGKKVCASVKETTLAKILCNKKLSDLHIKLKEVLIGYT